MDRQGRTAGRGAGRRLLPGAGRAVLHDAARRPGRRRDQGREPGRRRDPQLDAPGARRRRRPTTWASTAASARSRWTCATRTTSPPPSELARARRRDDRELQAGRAGPVRAGLRVGARRATPASSTARSAGSAPAPGAHVPGYDLMVQAMSGLMSLTGDPDGPPYRAGISVFDVMAGNHAVIGILAALRHRDATGEGQHVEVNLLSSALSGLVNHSSAYVAGGVVPFRMGNAHPSVFPYEPLPTADDDLIVAAANDGQFRKLVRGARHPRGRRRPAVRAQRRPHREPRAAAPAAGRAAGHAGRAGVVRPAGRGRRAVRADQHHRRRVRPGRALRAGPGRHGRRGRAGDAHDPQPDPVLGHARRATSCRPPSSTSTAPSCGSGWRTPPEAGRG